MSAGSPNPQADVKMLPATQTAITGNGPGDGTAAASAAPTAPVAMPATPAPASAVSPARPPAGTGIIPSSAPTRQLSDLPKDELEHLAEEYGLDPHDYRTPQHLVVAL